jgi:hypothetical protein
MAYSAHLFEPFQRLHAADEFESTRAGRRLSAGSSSATAVV